MYKTIEPENFETKTPVLSDKMEEAKMSSPEKVLKEEKKEDKKETYSLSYIRQKTMTLTGLANPRRKSTQKDLKIL